jgi:hypothetical protein
MPKGVPVNPNFEAKVEMLVKLGYNATDTLCHLKKQCPNKILPSRSWIYKKHQQLSQNPKVG